jgi:hypothetical protein
VRGVCAGGVPRERQARDGARAKGEGRRAVGGGRRAEGEWRRANGEGEGESRGIIKFAGNV